MESLRQYEGETVRIVTKKGNVYEGYISDYCFADDCASGIESIIMDEPLMMFEPDDIESIEIVKS